MTAPLRDASELIWPAVQETLAALGLGSEDSAAKKLAQRYAQIIDGLPDSGSERSHDQAWGIRWIGPELLRCLDALGATPDARARIAKLAGNAAGKDPGDAAPVNWLDQQRQSRAARSAKRT